MTAARVKTCRTTFSAKLIQRLREKAKNDFDNILELVNSFSVCSNFKKKFKPTKPLIKFFNFCQSLKSEIKVVCVTSEGLAGPRCCVDSLETSLETETCLP